MEKSDIQRYFETKRKRCLTRKAGGKRDEHKLISVDIETGLPGEETLGGSLVLGCWIHEDDPETPHWFTTIEEWVDAIFHKANRSCVWVAHNGGEFDYKYLLEYLVEHASDYPGMKTELVCRKDGRVIAIVLRYQKRKYTLMDSFALVPVSLRAMTKALAPEWAKKEREWTNPDGTTNYFRPDDPTDREYLFFDTRGLVEAMRKYKDTIFELFRVNTSYTAGGTAMRAWRASLPRSAAYWRQRSSVERYGREAYKGGLVFLTTTKKQFDMVHVDVNAMYAWAMLQGVPVGSGSYTRYEEPEFPGIYRVHMHVPETEQYPFLATNDSPPLRPRGSFDTTVTSIELAEARNRGYAYEVIDGFIFDGLGKPFDKFIRKCESLEQDHKGDAIGFGVKIMRNSLYGKFGTVPVAAEYILSETPPDDSTPVINPQTGEIISYLHTKLEIIDEPYLQPVWAAFITAHARIRLSCLATTLHAVYGDTDSVVFPAELLEAALSDGTLTVSKLYGDVKVEHSYEWFQTGGPKNYQALVKDPAPNEDEMVDKVKGIPRNKVISEEHTRALNGEKVNVKFLSMNSTLSVLKRHVERAQERQRHYSLLANSVQWQASEDGSVWPVLVGTEKDKGDTG